MSNGLYTVDVVISGPGEAGSTVGGSDESQAGHLVLVGVKVRNVT